MKRLSCIALAASFLMLSTHRSQAPIAVPLALALKCVATGVIGTTAIILYRCEPDYFLCCRQVDGEDPEWFASQSTAACLKKTNSRRWEGPWKKRAEPDYRSWVNNRCFAQGKPPMFPMGPLGTIPGPTYTNFTLVTASYSLNGGNHAESWRSAGTVLVEPGESNWSICLLGPRGTNQMTAFELQQVAECDLVVPNAIPTLREIKEFVPRVDVIELREDVFGPRNASVEDQ